MYLMYVDESGDSGLVGSPTDHFALSGIVVHESDWRRFIDYLIAFRRKMRSVYGLKIRDEIHSSEFIAKNPVNLPRHVRLAILRNTLDELARFDAISITNVIVGKRGKPLDYDVFSVAWGTLFQRFENTMIYGNFPGRHRDDHGLVLTDATAGESLSKLMRRMAVYNPIPSDAMHGPGTRNMPITRIIEDVHGVDSRRSLPIQMCDVVAYFLMQRHRPNAYIKSQHAERYFDRLAPVLNRRASRSDPALGIVRL